MLKAGDAMVWCPALLLLVIGWAVFGWFVSGLIIGAIVTLLAI
jgi:hypothetical protein